MDKQIISVGTVLAVVAITVLTEELLKIVLLVMAPELGLNKNRNSMENQIMTRNFNRDFWQKLTHRQKYEFFLLTVMLITIFILALSIAIVGRQHKGNAFDC